MNTNAIEDLEAAEKFVNTDEDLVTARANLGEKGGKP